MLMPSCFKCIFLIIPLFSVYFPPLDWVLLCRYRIFSSSPNTPWRAQRLAYGFMLVGRWGRGGDFMCGLNFSPGQRKTLLPLPSFLSPFPSCPSPLISSIPLPFSFPPSFIPSLEVEPRAFTLSNIPSASFIFILRKDLVKLLNVPGWAWTCSPPALAPQRAGITSTCYHTQLHTHTSAPAFTEGGQRESGVRFRSSQQTKDRINPGILVMLTCWISPLELKHLMSSPNSKRSNTVFFCCTGSLTLPY